jgi:hypothetical protein
LGFKLGARRREKVSFHGISPCKRTAYAAKEAAVSAAANAATRLAAIAFDLEQLREDIFFLDLTLKKSDGRPAFGKSLYLQANGEPAPLFAVPQQQ